MDIEIPEPEVQIKITLSGAELRALLVAVNYYKENASVPAYLHEEITTVHNRLDYGMYSFTRTLKDMSGNSMLYIDDQELLKKFRSKLSPGETDAGCLKEWMESTK